MVRLYRSAEKTFICFSNFEGFWRFFLYLYHYHSLGNLISVTWSEHSKPKNLAKTALENLNNWSFWGFCYVSESFTYENYKEMAGFLQILIEHKQWNIFIYCDFLFWPSLLGQNPLSYGVIYNLRDKKYSERLWFRHILIILIKLQ